MAMSRVIDQSARASDGLLRFKVRVDGQSHKAGTLYILAASKAEAEGFYLTHFGLMSAELVTTQLAD